jgi:hypothetical protein
MHARIAAVVALPVAALAAGPVVAAAQRDGPATQFHEAENLLPALESTAPAGDEEPTPGHAVARRVTLDPAASGNAYVSFENESRGNRFTLRFPVAASRTYTLVVRPVRGPEHGVVRMAVDGRRAGPRVDLAAGRVRRAAPLRIARRELARGGHTLTVTVVRRSGGLGAGLDYLELRPAR